MAFLNAEVVFVLCTLFVLRNVSRHVSLAHKWLDHLTFWLPPSAEDLRELVPRMGKKGRTGPASKEEWLADKLESMPRDIEALLARKRTRVLPDSLRGLIFFDTFETLVVIVLTACVTFVFSELWTTLRGASPHALVHLFLLFAAFMCFSGLFQYFPLAGFASTEARAALVTGTVAAVAFFALAHAPSSVLDFSLREAVADVTARAATLLGHMGVQREVGASFATFASVLALVAGLLAGCLFLPAFRFAKCYHAAVSRPPGDSPGPLLRAALHANFFAPLFLALAWVRPMTSDLVLTPFLTKCSSGAFTRNCVAGDAEAAAASSPLGLMSVEGQPHPPRVTEEHWEVARLCAVLLFCALRTALLRPHMQSYLAGAASREVIADVVSDMLSRPSAGGARRGAKGAVTRARLEGKEPTREERQAQLWDRLRVRYSATYSFLLVAAVQYTAPAFLTAALALTLKRKGEVDFGVGALVGLPVASLGGGDDGSLESAFVARLVRLFPSLRPEHLNVLSPAFYRAVVGALLWWSLVSWFVLSAAGLAYYVTHNEGGLVHTAKLEEARRGGESSPRAPAAGPSRAPRSGKRG